MTCDACCSLSLMLLRLKAENAALVRRLVELKEKEIERMNMINMLHEEAVSAGSHASGD